MPSFLVFAEKNFFNSLAGQQDSFLRFFKDFSQFLPKDGLLYYLQKS